MNSSLLRICLYPHLAALREDRLVADCGSELATVAKILGFLGQFGKKNSASELRK
jgi:hypothetical protein